MTYVYDRLTLNFDTSRYGDASYLTPGASNTLNLVANTTPPTTDWQKADLAAGGIVRSNYFKNPTTIYVSDMLTYTSNIANNAYLANNFVLSDMANNLIVSLNAFGSHTNNISGLNVVSDPTVPSYESASSVGQMNMMTLSKTDGVPANTVPILGSFSSLFIQDILVANTAQLKIYSNEYANSIVVVVDIGTGNTSYSSNLSNSTIANIESYITSTSDVLNNTRNSDWTFYRNSLQLARDNGFLQQFSNMGATNTYLINNVIGTDSLKTKLTSANT